MCDQIKNIIERQLKTQETQLLQLKQSPKKFLKVPAFVYNNPEYYVLHEVKKLDDAYFAIVEGKRKNCYATVFVVIRGFVFELDEYSFEALGMNAALEEYYHQNMENYAFSF